MLKKTLHAILVLSTVASAEVASQTDWTGGPGILGPVLELGNSFNIDSDAAWVSLHGDLVLSEAFTEYKIEGWCDGANSVCTEDLDDDGDMDALCAALYTDSLCWWENRGPSLDWICHSISGYMTGFSSVTTGDIDGDGNIDIVSSNLFYGHLFWWENADGSGMVWNQNTIVSDFLTPWSVHVDDIDGDGDADVLGAGGEIDEISWWENTNGVGSSWVKHTIDSDFDGARSVYSGDIDGDGDADVLGAAMEGDEIAWWENADAAATLWIKHSIISNFDGAVSVHTSDIDGDGDLDVLGAAFDAGVIAWWENLDSSGESWSQHNVDTEFDLATSVCSEDIDGDGNPDILGTSCVDNDANFNYDLAWWENSDGTGANLVAHKIDSGITGSTSACAADVSGDDEMDIIAAGFGGDELIWLDIEGYSPIGMLESSILDVQAEPDWGYLDWSDQIPMETLVAFQIRASDDYAAMGDWSSVTASPTPLEGVLDDSARYVQYRVILGTSDPELTPRLHEVSISWNPLGITGEPQITAYSLRGAEPNPASGAAAIRFEVPTMSAVELSVYDLAGRMVARHQRGDYSRGSHIVQFRSLTPGIYLCRMFSGDFTGIQRFIVIK